MELGVMHANSVNYMKEAKATYFNPTTGVVIAHRSVSALWDSGSAITVISNKICQDFKLTVDKSVVIQYPDVNKVVKDTLGSVTLNLFGDSIKLQVVEGLAREIILRYNLMKRWNAVLHTNNNYVLLEVNNKKFKVNISSRKPDSNNNVFATDAQQAQIKEVLKQYTDVLAHKDNKPGVTDLVEFTIDTGDNPPVYTTPRPYHPRIQKQIDDKFEELIRNGICSKVDFIDWGSPVTVVPKPDGSLRLCGDYVKLNAITKPIKYPFVNLHMALQSLGQAKVFSKADLLSSYHQILYVEQPLNMTEWDSKLRLARFIYNNMLNQATGFALFEIIHGRSVRTTQAAFKDENKPKLYRETVETPQSQFAGALKQDLEATVELVYDKLSGAHQDQENASASATKEGDLVYMFNTAGSSKKRPR